MTNPHGKDVVRTKECNCLNCGAKLDALGTADRTVEAKPEPGNLAVCIKCGAVMMLAEDLTLRGMTSQEMDDVTADHEFMNELATMVRKVHFVSAMN